MRRNFYKLLSILLVAATLCLVSCASSNNSKEDPAPSLDLNAAKPLLNTAAEALAYDINGGFDSQPDEYFFSNHISALLRDSVLGGNGSAFYSDLSDNYKISKDDLTAVYSDIYAEGSYPGVYTLEGSARTEDGGETIVFTIPRKGILSSVMTFTIAGMNKLDNGDILLHADLIATVEASETKTDVGDYEIIVRLDSLSSFGCKLVSVKPKSVVYRNESKSGNSAAPDAQLTPASPDSSDTSAPVTEAPKSDLDEYFGYSSKEAMEDMEPMITAIAAACVQMEFNMSGVPDDETAWRTLWLMADEHGTRLNGATLTNTGIFMLHDDVLLLYLDTFASPGEGLPEVPDSYGDMVTGDEHGVMFLPAASRPEAEINGYVIDDDAVAFAVSVKDDISVNVLVTLIPSEISNYGFAVYSAALR